MLKSDNIVFFQNDIDSVNNHDCKERPQSNYQPLNRLTSPSDIWRVLIPSKKILISIRNVVLNLKIHSLPGMKKNNNTKKHIINKNKATYVNIQKMLIDKHVPKLENTQLPEKQDTWGFCKILSNMLKTTYGYRCTKHRTSDSQ